MDEKHLVEHRAANARLVELLFHAEHADGFFGIVTACFLLKSQFSGQHTICSVIARVMPLCCIAVLGVSTVAGFLACCPSHNLRGIVGVRRARPAYPCLGTNRACQKSLQLYVTGA